MAKDPVCGMDVNPETSNWVTEHHGQSYYFCSEGCTKAFNTNPSQYLERMTPSNQTHQHNSMGGCCGGGGMGGGWMRYVYLGFMLLYLASIFLR
jgi:Cu+-exporting ATPase